MSLEDAGISARILNILGQFTKSPLDKRVAFAAAWIAGERIPRRLGIAAGITSPTATHWKAALVGLEAKDRELANAYLTRNDKRRMLSRMARDETLPPAVRLSSMDLDAKLAGDFAAKQVDHRHFHQLGGKQPMLAIDAEIAEIETKLLATVHASPDSSQAASKQGSAHADPKT